MKCIFFVFSFLVISSATFAQTFFDGYLHELDTNIATSKTTEWNKRNVKMLKEVFNKVEKDTKTSMFTKDTLYIISYAVFDIPYSQTSMLVWNSEKSCYYRYSFETKKEGGIINRHFVIQTNAYDRVSHLKPQLKQWIEAVDTLDYNAYKMAVYKEAKKKADSLSLNYKIYNKNDRDELSNGAMFFVVAIRSGKSWRYVSSKCYAANIL